MSVTPSVRVWIVDDLPRFREVVAEVLSMADGVECTGEFGSVEDVIAVLHDRFAPDVVLMDIGLPGMSGVEGVAELKRRSPGTAVVMLTVHEDNDTIFRAICAGAVGYLVKNARAHEIVQAVRNAHQGGATMSAPIARRVLNMFVQLNAPGTNPGLTQKEVDVLKGLVAGKTAKSIAAQLHISYHTVDTHVRHIYAKLHVRTRAEVVAKALRDRLV